jgi:hypothetical protein
VDETLLYFNARNAEMDAVAAKYMAPPYNLNIKVMGNGENYHIAHAISWLVGNATNEHVLFLEKDFQLVESLDCAMEQLHKGVSLLKVRLVPSGRISVAVPAPRMPPRRLLIAITITIAMLTGRYRSGVSIPLATHARPPQLGPPPVPQTRRRRVQQAAQFAVQLLPLD